MPRSNTKSKLTTQQEALRECSKCKLVFPETSDYFSRNGKYWRSQCKDCSYKASEKWRQQNKERDLLTKRKWYLKNQELHLQNIRDRYYADPISKIQQNRNRNIKLIGVVTSKEIAELVFEQNGICHYCKKIMYDGYTQDHKIPVSRGGLNTIDNIVLCCQSCNCKKGVLTDIEYFERLTNVQS